ncbi:MAG: hypothetical protein KY446_06260 [Proteobacteria bacterium]|nr:hypothetical protein [Pseudomonadota bacterium]MBW3617346.1 hypothetical protein [Pseudomonadota bacterium]
MAKPDPTVDPTDRFWNREILVLAIVVGLFILGGAIYTLINGPQPTQGAGGAVAGVEERVTPSGAVRPANAER